MPVGLDHVGEIQFWRKPCRAMMMVWRWTERGGDGAREEREADGAERTSGQPLGVLEDACDVGEECLPVRERLSGPRGA